MVRTLIQLHKICLLPTLSYWFHSGCYLVRACTVNVLQLQSPQDIPLGNAPVICYPLGNESNDMLATYYNNDNDE